MLSSGRKLEMRQCGEVKILKFVYFQKAWDTFYETCTWPGWRHGLGGDMAWVETWPLSCSAWFREIDAVNGSRHGPLNLAILAMQLSDIWR